MKWARVWLMLGVAALSAQAARPVDLVWPTPSTAWKEGRPPREFLQHAGSGDPASGGFGGVRSGGTQFHEGLDIKPVSRDRRGEPTDGIFAAMAGVVRHVSRSAGNSNYGRYVVLEHPDATPAVYTLYAHLGRIVPGLKPGDLVSRGQVIGTMGYSAGGYVIPRERAHLHFEIGLMVTRDFRLWYSARKFGSPNEHGLWNGMNLMGIDPLDFFNQWRARRVRTFQDYFAGMEAGARVRIASRRVPDFIQRYPSLLTKPLPETVGGWEITFHWTGLPFAWTPLTPMETIGLGRDQITVSEVNLRLVKQDRSKSLVVARRGKWIPGKDLQTVMQQLFNLR